MPERIDWILKRRSIRQYQAREVEEEKIELLLKAAMAAPSAANKQPWHFIIIRDQENLKAMSEKHIYWKMLKEAPLCLAVCGDSQVALASGGFSYWVQDCAAAMENLLLAASSLDLGAVWLGVYPNQEREEEVSKLLGLPEEIKLLGMASIGYPAETKAPRTNYREDRIYYESYGDKD